jgi:hypothetical protein
MEPTVTRLAALASVAVCAIAVVQAEPAHAQAPRTEAAQPMPIFSLGEPLSPVLEQRSSRSSSS